MFAAASTTSYQRGRKSVWHWKSAEPVWWSENYSQDAHIVPGPVESILVHSFITRFIYTGCFGCYNEAHSSPRRAPAEGDDYESVHWPYYVSAAAGHCGRRRPESLTEQREIGHGVPSLAGRMFPPVCCRAAQPSWLKGCVHLVPLMGVISGSGSKHSGYKIKHECIKVMPGACLLPVLLSAERKSEIEKRH